jgi:hypothetical protein
MRGKRIRAALWEKTLETHLKLNISKRGSSARHLKSSHLESTWNPMGFQKTPIK